MKEDIAVLIRMLRAFGPLLTLLTLSVGFLAGCELAVGPASPHPNVVVAADKAPGSLTVAPDILDTFVIPATGAVAPTRVSGWRGTLERGFHAAFPTGGRRTLEIVGAELSFAPAAVSSDGSAVRTAAVRAQIRFKARVISSSGKELGAIAGMVEAREANTAAGEAGMTDNASKAVEAMYEYLATDLLTKS
jgi:hypothetical protein